MTIVFLGTSNCVMGASMVDAARQSTDEQIVNASIGSSPSELALYLLSDLKLKQHDVIFIDYAITDGFYLLNGNIDESRVRRAFNSITQRLSVVGCLPICIINPLLGSFDADLPAEKLHRSICQELRIPIFDVTALVRQVARLGCEPGKLMRDPAHHSAAVSMSLGTELISAVEAVRTASRQQEAITHTRTIALAPLVPMERRALYKSSLRSSEMAILRQGEPLNLPISRDETVLGLVVNMGGSGAKLRLYSSEGEEIRDLIYDWSNTDPDAYMSIFVALRKALPGGAEGVTLEVLPVDGPETVPEPGRPSVLDQRYDEIRVEGVLVAGADTSRVTRHGVLPNGLDLLAERYQALAQSIFALVHA